MEPDWKELARNISDYVDNDTFLSTRSPQQIAKILNYAKLSSSEFATLFTNLSNYHGKADILIMLSRAHLKDFNSQEEAIEISTTITSILGIQILDSLFSFYQSKLQREIPQIKNDKSQSSVPEYIRIYVDTPNGNRLFENIDLNIRVEVFRSLVLKKIDKSIKYIDIYYLCQRLIDGHTLKEYNVQNNSNFLAIKRYYPFTEKIIEIMDLDGIRTKLENIDLNYRVEELKALIQDKMDLSPDQQKLCFLGKAMENGKTLKDYNVLYGDGLTLTWTKSENASPPSSANSITIKTKAGREFIFENIDLN
ncbi:Ubiquitin family protein [Trichomonas vaginalis G3]|uniref:Ubiquitin family protein n=1 Tax=Trichomonas vaginalis (strain ATCC PRA-98 / G3) TaxID=412133 RepID=A2DXE4_TRIV3|nr:cellular macromolecule catabolic process [Trichomonas vaginalis G3]EAY14896.1 Ubiquitin family protein [Trichomonas vaginalis G3]KAI5485445.1 cellular macromolecule catabolic process [Trichomonas vaginalis G3]|eukprot:XP_001327119.1 Ubiquitin family protein [Trichomonas vaginalis G3]